MIPKKSLVSVLDKSIILTITSPNDNAKSISVQWGGGGDFLIYTSKPEVRTIFFVIKKVTKFRKPNKKSNLNYVIKKKLH